METEDMETIENEIVQEIAVSNQIEVLQPPLETPETSEIPVTLETPENETEPLQTPENETETEDKKTRLKIPILINNRRVATLIEITDTDTTTDTDFTPSQEISSTEIEFTPIDEKQPQNFGDEAMECDEKTESQPILEFFIEKNVVELARCSWRGSSKNQRYLKGCLWSPDGTCLLTTVNGDGMQVFEMPRDLYGVDTVSSERPLDCLQSAVHIKEGGIVYDYCWFPFMNSGDPATCW